jgi:hypothetical protein
MLAHKARPPQIVIMVNQIIPQIPLVRSHQLQRQFAIVAEEVFERSVTEQGSLSKSVSFEVILRLQARR